MRVLDLFSGIGGFSLGLERAGMTTVAFCEIDPYAQAVLRKHWPGVPIYDDVRELTAVRLRTDGILGAEVVADATGEQGRRTQQRGLQADVGAVGIDVICGGFPCQDISNAGKGAGIDGARSGLWSEYARIIGEVRPRYVIVENVAALLGRGMGRVLGDLAALGYDAEWQVISAADVGAPHLRERVWIVAYAERDARQSCWAGDADEGARGRHIGGSGQRAHVADADEPRLAQRIMLDGLPGADARQDATVGGWWRAEPNLGRVAHGIPSRVDRLRCLGNAVVPQIPEMIGRAILAA